MTALDRLLEMPRSAAVAAGERKFHIEAVQAAGMRPFKLGAAANACSTATDERSL